MGPNEVGLLICTVYFFVVEIIGLNFALSFILSNKNFEARTRVQLAILVLVVALVLGPVLFLLVGTFAIAYAQTAIQKRKRK
jgi:hypothetical protein